MRPVFTILFCALILPAQELQKIDKVCSLEDVETFGLTCSEDDPCPVFLELASVDASGPTLFVAGNLHTVNTTLFGVLLRSDDAGKTWTEAVKRPRSAALEQIQFFDLQHGWTSGVTLDPLPKDPFFLVTTDGGKTWRQNPLFEESRFGSIQQFWFESARAGQLILDRSQGQNKRYELYETMTGGSSWELKEVNNQAAQLAKARPKEYATLRIRADAESYHVERRTTDSWEKVTSFAIHAGDCR